MKLTGAFATKQKRLKIKKKRVQIVSEITAILINGCSEGNKLNKQ
jgi:hypothetical protein